MNYYTEIKNRIIDDEVYSRVKDYSKERHKVITYFEIGKLLNEAGKEYGKNIIKQYSEKLMVEVGKKYNERNLRYMRELYKMFLSMKWNPLGSKLTWSHYRELLIIKNINEIRYYINVCEKNNLSKRQLQEKIKTKEYERLPEETKNKLMMKEEVNVKDLVPDPIIIRNKNNIDVVSEKVLHKLILEDIESFMKELGDSFSFIGSEYKIKIGDAYHSIDLLLFNIKYNAYVVVELKITKFKVEYISQIQKYMNYIDKNIKEITNNDTIGIIVCKKEDKFVMEYSSDDRIMIREFVIN